MGKKEKKKKRKKKRKEADRETARGSAGEGEKREGWTDREGGAGAELRELRELR